MDHRGSYDSSHVPLNSSNAQYRQAYNPDSSSPYRGEPKYSESGYYLPPKKKGISPWVKFGIPVAILIIAGGVIGAILGTRKHNSSNNGTPNSSDPASVSAAISAKDAIGVFPMSTNSYEQPIYPSTTNAAAFSSPTFLGTNAKTSWPADPFQPSNPSPTQVRSDRPRIIAPGYKWAVLPDLIKQDPYMAEWNDTIFGNATLWKGQSPVPYVVDGSSGVLDVARQVKERIKAWSYAYRMTNDSSWAERAWQELMTASGNTTTQYGTPGDNWNSVHFLDVGEFTAAFGIAYDWLYDYWTPDRRTGLMWTMLSLGISKGIASFNGATYGWWSNAGITGNWNCVCNGGLTIGALAILGDDPTGMAAQMLSLTIPNAQQNCAFGVFSDGSWAETANYWYFGTTGYAEMASALITATGSPTAFGLTTANPDFSKTGLFHMHVFGMTSLFNYGDHGPNKYSTNANSMMFLGSQYNIPAYTLHQRDRQDSGEPHGMFWYDPSVSGAFWDGMPLDHFFTNSSDAWAAMRTSWTDVNGLYVAMKSSKLLNHQTHGDLDVGDFVLDALGQRWAGEYGSGDYLSTGYFSSETQDSQRWLYYRKRTEGQSTLLIGGENQNVDCAPTTNSGTTGESQGSSTVYNVPGSSTAFFTTDMTSAYNQTTSAKRGIRFINGRKQVLLQDDVDAQADIEWRMHTNATVSIDNAGTTATLSLGGQTMKVQIVNPSDGSAKFSTRQPVRLDSDPPLPTGQVDQPNPGVTVLTIPVPPGQYSLQVLFTPQYPGVDTSTFAAPKNVPIDNWSVTSH